MVRYKNRYLLLEMMPVDSSQNLIDYTPLPSTTTAHHLQTHLRNTITTLLGHQAPSPTVKYVNWNTGMVMVRLPRDMEAAVRVAFMVGSGVGSGVSEGWMIWRCVHVAGTIRSLQKVAVRYARKRIGQIGEALERSGGKGKKVAKFEVEEEIKQHQVAINRLES